MAHDEQHDATLDEPAPASVGVTGDMDAADGHPMIDDAGAAKEVAATATTPVADEPPVADGSEASTDADAVDEPVTWRRFDLRTDPEAAIEAAIEAIEAGQCIVLPTDTVYGIGADPFSSEAVQGLLDAKHRGRDMPPPVLIAEPAMLEALGSDVEAYARRLADECWPGALTLIVSMQTSLRVDLGDTRGTIALRVPDHDATRDLLRRTGPLAVSSANVSGRPSSTSIDDAIEQLGNSVAVYLDAGPTPGETPSTIIDFVSESFGRIVRQGALGLDRIREIDPFVEEYRAPEPDPTPETDATTGQGATASDPANGEVTGDAAVVPSPDTVADPPAAHDLPHEPGTSHDPATPRDGDAAPAL